MKYNVTIEGYIVLTTKSHLRARIMFKIYRFLFPCLEIFIDIDGIITY